MNATSAGTSPHVLFVALYNGDSFLGNLERTCHHLNASGTSHAPVQFHAFVNKVVARAPAWLRQHDLASMPEDAQAQHHNLSRHKPRGASVFLWKAFLYRLIPVAKLIVLDLDVALVGGAKIHGLWSQFDAFGPHEVLGVVPEQGPTYGKSTIGYNGGVQLHHLERMRASGLASAAATSSTFGETLRGYASGSYAGWDRTEPNLGDQTLYTHLCHKEPHLCHSLPCGWNRQMSTRYYSAHDFTSKWHACPSRCKLLHFNQPLLEGIVPVLQTANRPSSCAECRAALAGLENRTRSSGSRNPKFMWGASKVYMARMIDSCCCPAPVSEGPTAVRIRKTGAMHGDAATATD